MRKVKFQIGEYYHIYNRGVDKRDIFLDEKDYTRFIVSMREFNQVEAVGSLYEVYSKRKNNERQKEAKPPVGGLASKQALVEILCYSLIPNHYHLMLKQLADNGVVKFMQKFGTAYTMYFNQKYNRAGSLFQGTYKAVHIRTSENLFRLSSYINANAEIHKITQAENWTWSSYQDYLGKRNGTLINKKAVSKEFGNTKDYKFFTDYIIKESRQAKDEIKNYFLE